jgi:hypothetical protein
LANPVAQYITMVDARQFQVNPIWSFGLKVREISMGTNLQHRRTETMSFLFFNSILLIFEA